MTDALSAKAAGFADAGLGSADFRQSDPCGARYADQHGLPLYFDGSVLAGIGTKPHQLLAKRVADIMFSVLALIALTPLMLIVALLIKLTTKGPVIFRQSRLGLHGKPFLALKFRTMHRDACDPAGMTPTIEGDPRITSIGRFLRRTSIDELPQLFNVLRGDMSLVGPRPHVEAMQAGGLAYAELVPYYARRLDMLPGMTGWAQANGLRGPTDQPETARARIDHDIAYIQNFSLRLDLAIIVMTLRREIRGGSGL